MKFIFGLGNPGKDYVGTRHNVGFEALDQLAKDLKLDWSRETKRHAWVAKGVIGDIEVLLVKPTTYMNASGQAVQSILSFYKGVAEDCLVIHDEMDVPVGRIAFLGSGGHAGHNGVADIQEKLGTDHLTRMRIGIGRPATPQPKEDWVLGKAREDKEKIDQAILHAAKAAQDWVTVGPEKAMNTWNRK